MPETNYYKLLQVDPAAEPDVIAAAHRALAAKLHPERDASGIEEVRRRELDRALAVLRDPAERASYDQQLAEVASNHVAVGPGHQSYTLADRMQARDTQGMAALRIDFGRYTGWTLGELVRTDPEYLQWLSRHSSGIRYRGAILRLLADRQANRQPLRASS
jgi:DnaJ-class molecular chaperone